ncbi:unnamed protein product [Phytophthora fragariaefolia]|uniref:Unnamed protein product n=1 Tax=Phytophthora fragariaefolia TaxID=1490495 RepID=A0A9W7D032_9STRA|nr:unnamed protein product [Phytophthora fragariaefolia]
MLKTSEIYQTFKSGWCESSLRTLLVNILDPDGPLGIHSYYPDGKSSNDHGLDVDVKTVRREAFYLSCGLFDCRCTKSFEHSRAATPCARLHHLRQFILDNFMRDTFDFVLREDISSLLETMVPVLQFVRAVLNHANLNENAPRATHIDVRSNSADNLSHQKFQLNEIHPCLEWIVECLIKLISGEDAVGSTISCVLLIELCGIICEAITFNEHQPMFELITLVELVLVYLQSVYAALSKRTTAVMKPLFSTYIEHPPSAKLSSYDFSPSAFRSIVVERGQRSPVDSYDINLARVTTDLLAAIGRVAQQCQKSSNDRLRSFTTIAP